MKEELKYVSMEYGVQSVMTTGVVLMLLLYANNLDMLTLDVREVYSSILATFYFQLENLIQVHILVLVVVRYGWMM